MNNQIILPVAFLAIALILFFYGMLHDVGRGGDLVGMMDLRATSFIFLIISILNLWGVW